MVFDLGGNIGSFSLYFDMLYKDQNYEGHVFEPHPGNFDLLERNLRLNDVKNFKPVMKAVSGINGQLKFDISGGYDEFRIDSKSKRYITVEAVRLSDYCRDNGIDGIDLLKMDIEGGEYDIFRHETDFMMRTVKTIMLEYHNIDESNSIDYIVGILDKGFDLKIERGDQGGGILTATNKYIN